MTILASFDLAEYRALPPAAREAEVLRQYEQNKRRLRFPLATRGDDPVDAVQAHIEAMRIKREANEVRMKSVERESVYVGVELHGKSWRARKSIGGHTRCLGTFPSEDAAARIVDGAILDFNPLHPRELLNFPAMAAESLSLYRAHMRGE